MEILSKDKIQEFENFNEKHPYGHFMQSVQWAKLKHEWVREIIVSRDTDGNIIGGMSVLIRKTPMLPFSIIYAGRAPVCYPDDTATIKDLFSGIKPLAKKHNSYIFKMEPQFLASDENFEKLCQNFGFAPPNKSKNFDGVQPRFVFRLDVGGKTEEEIMANFHSKTRYNIRVAVKNNVIVKQCGAEALDDFSRLMQTTGQRDGFSVRPKAYFERMLVEMGENARLYMAYYEGKAIAGTIPIQYGDKTWYLYGASDNEFRNMMPNYLLQWEMIKWAIEAGSKIYDFRGVSGDLSESNPLYGLYKFKKGFMGELTEFSGEFNLVLKPFINKIINLMMKVMKKLR